MAKALIKATQRERAQAFVATSSPSLMRCLRMLAKDDVASYCRVPQVRGINGRFSKPMRSATPSQSPHTALIGDGDKPGGWRIIDRRTGELV